jgi:N-acetylglucosaminyldiphosphoundecaprenol N-acetyl-beta-D-mannosaminyltransferase
MPRWAAQGLASSGTARRNREEMPADTPATDRIRLLGIWLDRITLAGAVERIAEQAADGRGGWVLTPNLDILRRLTRDRGFAELCEGTSLRLADGMPLIWASRLQRTPLPERAAGSDLIWPLCERAAKDGLTVFLLGGNPGASEAAADELRRRSPSLRIIGTECPAMGFESDAGYMSRLTARLQGLRPDLVFVGLGSPKQERLIRQLRPLLPRSWFLGIGVTLSFVGGEIRRAPTWMRRLGVEWLHRLAQEPRRLFKRYLLHGAPFACYLLTIAALRGVSSAAEHGALKRPLD